MGRRIGGVGEPAGARVETGMADFDTPSTPMPK
jgi:hypothetical protein